MFPLHGPILRALMTVALIAAARLDASASEPSGASASGPVVLSGEPAPAPLRRLTPRGESPAITESGRSGLPSAGSALSALAVVVLIGLGGARLWKTHGPKPTAAAPREAIEVLGRCRIEPRQSVYLVRLGSRILVLGSGGGELSTLSEVTDAVEVDLITAQCRDGRAGASPFTRLFEARRKAEDDPAEDVANQASSISDPPPSRWFRTSAEQRLADRVRGRATEEGASRVA